MKIVIATTPAPGHVNPMLGIARILLAEGHEVLAFTGRAFQERIEAIGATFRPIAASADQDVIDPFSKYPELKVLPPGLELLRVIIERLFVDHIPAQYHGLQQVLENVAADVVIGDDCFLGLLPLLLKPTSIRPPVVCFGTSILHWPREDGAPDFLGLRPAASPAEHAAVIRDHERIVHQPLARQLNQRLEQLGIAPLANPPFEAMVRLADHYWQLTVESFEFPRPLPASVRFIGTLPIIASQAPIPPWAGDLDGERKVVLVTQGTVANHDFNLLIAPTLAALAEEPDLLVAVTAGGRPVNSIPGPIPANARLASYLPFEWILPRADVLVTNGGYGSVNQALSFGVPLVCAGLTEDKADVSMRVGWSKAGINLETNAPTPQALRSAVRSVLDTDKFRRRASLMADEFRMLDTRAEIICAVNRLTQMASDRRRAGLMPAM
jgi:UDP:flavonoid glycosyltransferase YjiC (YdhE family)